MAFTLQKGYQVFSEIVSPDDLSNFLQLFPINSNGLINPELSELFDREKKQKVYEVVTRDSSRIKFEGCPKLFKALQKSVVDHIQAQIKDHEVILREDDLELVQYYPGQFFKAHTDHQNFTGNFFKNYTLILCCQPCSQGGQTIIYLDHLKVKTPRDQLELRKDYVEVAETGQKAGSVLIFDKDLYHEGSPVLEGRKVILIANLLLIPKSSGLEKQHYLKVNFADHVSYLIPEYWLSQKPFSESYYKTSLEFKKQQEPWKMIHQHQEDIDDHPTFKIFYQRMLKVLAPKNDTLPKLERLVNGLRMIHYPVRKEIDQLIAFLNGSGDHFMCSLASYYDYIKLLDRKTHPDILPFVRVETSGDTGNVLLWFGIGQNQLLTVDFKPQRTICNENWQTGQKTYGKTTSSQIPYLHLDEFHDFLYNSYDLDAYQINENRNFIFQSLGGTSLEKLSRYNQKNYYGQMKDYIVGMMNSINPSDSETKYVPRTIYNPVHLEDYHSKSEDECSLDELVDQFPEFQDYTETEFDRLKKSLNLNALSKELNQLSWNTSNDVRYSSGRICNEATYFECSLSVQAGFIRLTGDLYREEGIPQQKEYHLRKPRNYYDSDSEEY